MLLQCPCSGVVLATVDTQTYTCAQGKVGIPVGTQPWACPSTCGIMFLPSISYCHILQSGVEAGSDARLSLVPSLL